MPRRKTIKEFIYESTKKHNNFYDYSLVNYKNNKTYVIIICPIHGKFKQLPMNHLKGHSCKGCINDNQTKSKKEFIYQSNRKHNNKYDYSLVDYKNNKTYVIIICPIHGEFKQKPNNHINSISGCPTCGIDKRRKDYDVFVKESKKSHNNKYDYSLVDYKNNKIVVIIICPIHGEFSQSPAAHLNQQQGCPDCGGTKKKTSEEFIILSKETHDNKYDYSKLVYTNTKENVIITCPKHGDFSQSPHHHLLGSGCPSCNSSKGEKNIKKILEENKIKFTTQKTFNDCIYKNKLRFDFYLTEYNICIEFDGIQHYKPVNIWGGEKGFKLTQKRDKIKNNYCKSNNIRLLRIKYDENIKEKLNLLELM